MFREMRPRTIIGVAIILVLAAYFVAPNVTQGG